jgi:hypothetical protein
VRRGPLIAETRHDSVLLGQPREWLIMATANRLGAFVLACVGTLTLAACASDAPDDDQGGAESDLTANGARPVKLKYEGTCEFLRNCSTFSKNVPPGKVTWGCTGLGVCSDSAKWVAGPTRSFCGKTVTICKGSSCTTALVKDVSVTKDWEASNGVMQALGLPHGLTGKCSGFGGGNVTVAVGGKPPEDEPGPAGDRSEEDGEGASVEGGGSDRPASGCFSTSCDKTMPELSCVQSKTTKEFSQCKDGKWTRGTASSGPHGACSSTHPIGECD